MPAGGGDPLMFEHVFWFFGHPEVYIMILPAFGIISEILPTFSRKPLFGATSMIYAIASIAFLSFIVWGHHMFVDGMPMAAQLFFMMSTMLIAVPTGVKVFNWTATMWRGSLSFEPPMLFAIAFLFLFSIGGFSGLMLALTPVDFQYNNTYFVVAHFHYVLVPGAVFAIMAAVYYWLPKWTGHMYNMTAGEGALLAVGDLRQRAVLPAALPRAGRHAAAHPGLCRAVHRLEHGLLDRRLRLRRLADPVRHRASSSACAAARRRRRKCGTVRLRPGSSGRMPSPPPYPQLHGGAGNQMNSTGLPDKRRIRDARLVLMSVALAFYFGFIALAVYRSHH